jgi:hypothetical protein
MKTLASFLSVIALLALEVRIYDVTCCGVQVNELWIQVFAQNYNTTTSSSTNDTTTIYTTSISTYSTVSTPSSASKSIPTGPAGIQCSCASKAVPLYRDYNPTIIDHFYTVEAFTTVAVKN